MATEVALEGSGTPAEAGGLRDQVLVFRYKGKFHAINHVGGTESIPRIVHMTDQERRNALTRPILYQTAQPLTLKTLA